MYGQEMMKKEASSREQGTCEGLGRIATAPKRTGQIEEQIVIGQKLAEGLLSAIQRLQGSISSVLRQEPTCGEDEKRAEPSSSVGLAECLRAQNRKTEAAIDRINGMIDRCEL